MAINPDLWYAVNPETNVVYGDAGFECFFDAARHGGDGCTAMKGRYILTDDRWTVVMEE